MKSNYDYNEQFKDRLRALPFLAGLFAIVFLINKGIWTLDKSSVMYIFLGLIPIKILAILFRCLQLWIRENKKFVLLFLYGFMLLSAFIFDFEIIPKLLAYGSGMETHGKVVEMIVTNIKKSHFIAYEFTVNNEVFKKQQIVSASYFRTVNSESAVPVYYLRQNPKVSFIPDLDRLKFGTAGSLYLGLGIFASLYTDEIRDKITSIIKRGFQFRKPA